jgi:hypothetical protein
MLGTVENTHNKMMEKITLTKESVNKVQEIVDTIQAIPVSRARKKLIDRVLGPPLLANSAEEDARRCETQTQADLAELAEELSNIENNYILSVVNTLSGYYNEAYEGKNTQDYYRIIVSEGFIAGVIGVINKIKLIITSLNRVVQMLGYQTSRNCQMGEEAKDIEATINIASKNIERAQNIEITTSLEKKNYEICKCGAKMIVIPELSELQCPNASCRKVKTILGVVFRNDQIYPRENQKTKHGGYDTSRHYRFWIERIQALETKTFDEEDLANIEYVLNRDEYDRKTLTCEHIREALKDPKVSATHLNDHAALLVKIFGGRAPPLLNFQESKLLGIRFNKAMRLYDIVNPEGGNKPYYPYFIFVLISEMFAGNAEKLRLLDYIHLQSRETVIKNDKIFEQMCLLADERDGMRYRPTDPAYRL